MGRTNGELSLLREIALRRDLAKDQHSFERESERHGECSAHGPSWLVAWPGGGRGRFRETDRREEVGLNLSVCVCVAVFENNIKKKGGNRQQNTKKYTVYRTHANSGGGG